MTAAEAMAREEAGITECHDCGCDVQRPDDQCGCGECWRMWCAECGAERDADRREVAQ